MDNNELLQELVQHARARHHRTHQESLPLLLPPAAWHRVQPSQGFQQVSTMMAYAPVLVLVGSVNMEAIVVLQLRPVYWCMILQSRPRQAACSKQHAEKGDAGSMQEAISRESHACGRSGRPKHVILSFSIQTRYCIARS